MKVKSENEVAQSCLTLCDPMDYSLPGSSVRGIFQARVLEWGAITFSEFGILLNIYSISMTNTLKSGRSKDALVKIKWKRRIFSAMLLNIILRVMKGLKQGMNSRNGDCAQD